MRLLSRILLTCLLCTAALEGCLRYIDHNGTYRYRADQYAHILDWIASPRGYVLPAGTYHYSNWTATTDSAGNRSVPASRPHACRIAILGDSVAFGFGVDDADTFATVLAGEVDAQIINAALTGYTSENVLKTLYDVPADGYVYLAILNDDDVTHTVTRTKPLTGAYPQTAIETYIQAATWNSYIPDNVPRFRQDITTLAARDDVLIVTFAWANGWHKGLVRLAPDTVVLPMYSGTVSAYDQHPNAAGHRQIAAGLLPHVVALMDKVC